MKKEYIIPVFVSHLGCPETCVFCNQKKISGQETDVTKEDVKETIEKHLKNFDPANRKVEIAFFGGSFTAISEEIQNGFLEVANEYIKQKKVDSIRISTRPDYISKDILKRLKKYNVRTIELGVQSSNDYILKKSQRGHTFADVIKASKLIRRFGITLGHQMMVGLPESTEIDEINTAKALIKLKPQIVRIYPVLVIKGTALDRMYESGEYKPLTIIQAVERAKAVTELFNAKRIKVIRIGLQVTDEINSPSEEGSEVVAGPIHPAFRQLVESAIWYEKVSEKIKKINFKVKVVEIAVNPADVNNFVGQKRENIRKLHSVYNVETLIKVDNKIKLGKFKIKVLESYQN